MDRRLTAAAWIYAVGVFAAVLGVVHCVLALVILPHFRHQLNEEDARIFLFFYLASGVATTFIGWFISMAANLLRRGVSPWAYTFLWRCSGFLLLLGIGSSYVMFSHPFAHLTLLFAILLMLPLWNYSWDLRGFKSLKDE